MVIPEKEKSYIHEKKFIFNYPYLNMDEDAFIDWAIQELVTLKKNIDKINNELHASSEEEYELEDYQFNKELRNEKKSVVPFKYDTQPKLASDPIFVKGTLVYKRDKQVAVNALNHANYKCEFDANHYCFLKKDGLTPYTEAHHLIPLAYQNEFSNSLDVEQNVISLCSNCHRKIHYGHNARILISKLYTERKDLLKEKGIDISEEELLKFYGYDSKSDS